MKSSARRGLLRFTPADLGVVTALGLMAASAEALDLFHIVFLFMVVEAFLLTSWAFWVRLVVALGVVEFLLIRAGNPAWQDLAEPFVLATIAALVFLMHDSREGARARLRDLATRDPLTSMFNRRALQTHLDEAVAHGTPFAVVYIDLDGFKAVNDSHGHDVGDEVLIAVAGRMQHVTREQDIAGRIGGDEFALVLGSATSREVAEDVARRLVSHLEQPFVVGGVTLHVSASMGIVMVDASKHQTPRELLREADRAMFGVKRTNRGSYAFADAPGV